MSRIGIFAVAGQHLEWLAERRAVIASNIANASTPGYRARDIQSFDAFLGARERATLARSDAQHFADLGAGLIQTENAPGVTSHSGNDVALDRELLKASEVTRSQQLSLGVVRAFHRLTMMAAKG